MKLKSDHFLTDLERQLVDSHRRHRSQSSPLGRRSSGAYSLRMRVRPLVPAIAVTLVVGTACLLALTTGSPPIERSLEPMNRSGQQSPESLGDADGVMYAQPAHMRDLPAGWTQYDSGPQPVTRTPGAKTWTTITSFPYSQDNFGPARSLPGGEFIVQVALLRSQIHGSENGDLCAGVLASDDYPQIDLNNLVLADADEVDPGITGLPEYRLEGAYGDEYYVDIRVIVESLPTSQALVGRAERALTRLELPDWPDMC